MWRNAAHQPTHNAGATPARFSYQTPSLQLQSLLRTFTYVLPSCHDA